MVLEHDRRYAPAYAGMGAALFGMERYEDAIEALGTALEIRPESSFAGRLYLLMGRAQRELGRLDAAEAHFRRAMEIDPDTTAALFDLADVLHAQQRPDEADTLLRRVRQLRPGDAATLQRVAVSLGKYGRHEEALAVYREMLDINPDAAQTHVNTGVTLYLLGRTEDALRSFERAVEIDPDLETARSGLEQLRTLADRKRQ